MAEADRKPHPARRSAGEGAAPASLRVLVIDDEQNIRQTLAICLRGLGCDAELAATGREALDVLQQRAFDLAFLDLRLEQESGLDLLPQLLTERPGLDVVVITAYASVDSAVQAMRLGARDYLPKPFTPAQIRSLVERALDRRALEQRLSELEARLEREVPQAQLETPSRRMQSVLQEVRRAAAHEVPVLLGGEAGTGKGLLARALHAQSRRRDRPFVVVNCPTLPEELLASAIFGHAAGALAGAARDKEGSLEVAERGTLFLEEIGELPLALQAKLLRFLLERRFERLGETRTRVGDVRVVASTSRDLEADVKAGRFRENLLYRLNVMEIAVPPLRERIDDILPLAQAFIAFFARETKRSVPRLSLPAQKMLTSWTWPGNVRELRNVIERALILTPGGGLEPEAFPQRMVAQSTGAAVLGGDFSAEEIEKEHILRVLARTATLEEASRIVGIDVTTLWRKRKKWGR